MFLHDLVFGQEVIGTFHKFNGFNVVIAYRFDGSLIDSQVLPLTEIKVYE